MIRFLDQFFFRFHVKSFATKFKPAMNFQLSEDLSFAIVQSPCQSPEKEIWEEQCKNQDNNLYLDSEASQESCQEETKQAGTSKQSALQKDIEERQKSKESFRQRRSSAGTSKESKSTKNKSKGKTTASKKPKNRAVKKVDRNPEPSIQARSLYTEHDEDYQNE